MRWSRPLSRMPAWPTTSKPMRSSPCGREASVRRCSRPCWCGGQRCVPKARPPSHRRPLQRLHRRRRSRSMRPRRWKPGPRPRRSITNIPLTPRWWTIRRRATGALAFTGVGRGLAMAGPPTTRAVIGPRMGGAIAAIGIQLMVGIVRRSRMAGPDTAASPARLRGGAVPAVRHRTVVAGAATDRATGRPPAGLPTRPLLAAPPASARHARPCRAAVGFAADRVSTRGLPRRPASAAGCAPRELAARRCGPAAVLAADSVAAGAGVVGSPAMGVAGGELTHRLAANRGPRIRVRSRCVWERALRRSRVPALGRLRDTAQRSRNQGSADSPVHANVAWRSGRQAKLSALREHPCWTRRSWDVALPGANPGFQQTAPTPRAVRMLGLLTPPRRTPPARPQRSAPRALAGLRQRASGRCPRST